MEENSPSPPLIDYFDYLFGNLPDDYDMPEGTIIMLNMLFKHLNCSRCIEMLDQRFYSIMEPDTFFTIYDVFHIGFSFFSGFGVLSNIINFIVFYRQGILSDSCTVSLVGITVADFLCCLLSSFNCIMNDLFDEEGFINFKFSYNERKTIFSLKEFFEGHKQLFIQITCCISTFLALERFYSVAYPFKVKTIFTSTRTCLVVCVIFLVSFLISVPTNFYHLLVWSKQQGNTSALVRVRNPVISPNRYPEYVFNNYALRVVYILIITVLNFMIFWKVRASTKFRKSSLKIQKNISNTLPKTTSDKKKANTQRRKIDRKEMKLLRMVGVILSLLIVSYFPGFVIAIIYRTNFNKKISTSSRFFLDSFKILFETINSSCNIIIYFAMSTRYRQELQLFCCCKKKLK